MIDTKVRGMNMDFMNTANISQQVVGMNWIEVPAGSYELTTEDAKRSNCQIELSVRCVLSNLTLEYVQAFILLDTTSSSHICPKANGPKSHPCGF
jgi:hypothetical protein